MFILPSRADPTPDILYISPFPPLCLYKSHIALLFDWHYLPLGKPPIIRQRKKRKSIPTGLLVASQYFLSGQSVPPLLYKEKIGTPANPLHKITLFQPPTSLFCWSLISCSTRSQPSLPVPRKFQGFSLGSYHPIVNDFLSQPHPPSPILLAAAARSWKTIETDRVFWDYACHSVYYAVPGRGGCWPRLYGPLAIPRTASHPKVLLAGCRSNNTPLTIRGAALSLYEKDCEPPVALRFYFVSLSFLIRKVFYFYFVFAYAVTYTDLYG